MPRTEAKWQTVDRSLVHDDRVILYDHIVTLPDDSLSHCLVGYLPYR